MKTAIVVLCLLAAFVYPGWTQESELPYGGTQFGYLGRELDRLRDTMDTVASSLAEVREEIAEMRGRQSVTTGVAAGVPTSLAGLLLWWMKRKKREE